MSSEKYKDGKAVSHGALPLLPAEQSTASSRPGTMLHQSGPVPMAQQWSSTGSMGAAGVPGGGTVPEEPTDPTANETQELFREGYAFEGAAIVALVDEPTGKQDESGQEQVTKTMEIVLDDGVMLTLELDSGEKRLLELGYTQTLQRDLTGLELFAAGFNCVSLFAGIVPYYSTAFANGGPVAVVWYWWIPGVLANLMALSLAEIASSFPLAASMYFWTAHLAPPRIRPLAAWITGWLEFIGASVGTGGTVLAGVFLLSDIIVISKTAYTPGVPATALAPASPAVVEPSFALGPTEQFGMAAAVLVVVGVINFNKVKVLGQIMLAAAVYQILLGVAIIICVPAVAPTLQPASYVFGKYENNWVGAAPNGAYAFIIAMLLSQYSLYAMDTAAHISEEAKRSDVTTPIAMVTSLSSITVLAWAILVALTFSIQDPDSLSSADTVTGGEQYVVQILWDVFYQRYESGVGALVVVGLIYVSFFFCSASQIMTAARVAYALARDGGLPFSSVFTKTNSHRVPVYAVVLTCTIALVTLIPSIFTLTAYYAITGMATVGWFSAYAVPMFLRLVTPEDRFTPGPFYMAKYIGITGGKAVHLVGLLYVLYTICVFLVPTTFPIALDTFNYASIGIAGVVAFFLGWWIVDAHRWFKGPLVKDPGVTPLEDEPAASQESSDVPLQPQKAFQAGGSVEWFDS